jgi:hypothetical protein
MTSCSEAFQTIRPCAVLVVGIAGTMPVHGIGTACFYLTIGDKRQMLVIHNCLFCHGEDCFNLISVSQLLRIGESEVVFSQHDSRIMMHKRPIYLQEKEGLYELPMRPVYFDDPLREEVPYIAITLADDTKLWDEGGPTSAYIGMRSPSKLGIWKRRMFWTSCKVGIQGIRQGQEYEENLLEFCESYFVAPSQPAARKTYRVTEVQDMGDLSL